MYKNASGGNKQEHEMIYECTFSPGINIRVAIYNSIDYE